MKTAMIALCIVAVTLAACRREVPSYEPMKLGISGQHDTRQ